MGYIEVHGADLADGRIQQLKVKIPNVPARSVDRDTAIRWMRDGHSLIPVRAGRKLPALQLVDASAEPEALWVIRADNERIDQDSLPEMPAASSVDPDRVASSPAA